MESGQSDKSDIILRAEKLSRTVPSEKDSKTLINSFDFEFSRGGVYNIVGPSGAGKTSLLRLFNRLDEKSGGEVYFEDRRIEEYPVTDLRRKIALAFQIPHLFPGTVASNLAYCCGPELAEDAGFTSHYLKLVGLDPEMAGRNPEKLSVGQKQRVALARALVQEPEILLLDEPTSALDPGAARTIEDLIVKLNRELGLTLIMVTHNFRQALRLKGDSIFIVEGRMIETGLSDDLFNQPSHDLTRQFINGELR
jgi:putative ABC transport system ATP-binding protein